MLFKSIWGISGITHGAFFFFLLWCPLHIYRTNPHHKREHVNAGRLQ